MIAKSWSTLANTLWETHQSSTNVVHKKSIQPTDSSSGPRCPPHRDTASIMPRLETGLGSPCQPTPYSQLLIEFLTLMTPTTKYGVALHITKKGPPVKACKHRLPPDKLTAAKAEFKKK